MDKLSRLLDVGVQRVVGIDQSYSCTGIGVLECLDALSVSKLLKIETKPKSGASHVSRAIKIAGTVSEVVHSGLDRPSLIVVESPTYGAFKSDTLHALYALIIQQVLTPEVPAVFTPSGAHKAAYVHRYLQFRGVELPRKTVKGRSKIDEKEASRLAWETLFGEVDGVVLRGRGCISNDEVEAVLLAYFGYRFVCFLQGESGVDFRPFELELFGSNKKSKDGSKKGLAYKAGMFVHRYVDIYSTELQATVRDLTGMQLEVV